MDSRRVPRVARLLLVANAIALSGCAGLDAERATTRELTVADFAHPDADGNHPDAPVYFGSLPSMSPESADESPSGAATRSVSGAGATTTAPQIEAGQRWLVDGLLGQINGRPVFADEFLDPIESRLLEYANSPNPNRGQVRAAFLTVIHQHFERIVNSELVISEAESQLTPEQQQGLFAWLRTVQEEEIASRATTRTEASESLLRDLNMSIEDFLKQKRDAAMASMLLRKRVAPRTIVSWRDVEREYDKNEGAINPLPKVRVGRIALNTARDQDKIALVKERLGAKIPFTDIAHEIGVKDDGIALAIAHPEGTTFAAAIDANPDLRPEVKENLKTLSIGDVSEPIVVGSSTTWLALVDRTDQRKRTIFDPELQLQIKAGLRSIRQDIEQSRYIEKLRSRWISDDISAIEDRLAYVAMSRYWKG